MKYVIIQQSYLLLIKIRESRLWLSSCYIFYGYIYSGYSLHDTYVLCGTYDSTFAKDHENSIKFSQVDKLEWIQTPVLNH